MPEQERVALVVDSETKDRWQTAVEESAEYKTLSGLIRRAVSNELSDTAPATPSQTDADTGELTEMADRLKRIEQKIDEIDSRVSGIEGDTADTEDSVMKTKIFTELNSSDEAKSAERIAEVIGFPVEDVEEQLSELQSVTAMLGSYTGDDGTERYYTERE